MAVEDRKPIIRGLKLIHVGAVPSKRGKAKMVEQNFRGARQWSRPRGVARVLGFRGVPQ